MQDNFGNTPRDPAYDRRLETTKSGGNGIFFILGAIVVALGVIFFLVSGNEPSAPAPGAQIENSTTAPMTGGTDGMAPAGNAPAATAPVADPAAPTPAPAPEAAPAENGATGSTTAPAPAN